MRVVFLVLTLTLLSLSIWQKDKITSDIFSIIPDENLSDVVNFQKDLSLNATVLAPNFESIKELEKLNLTLNVFERLDYSIDLIKLRDNFSPFKLALFKGDIDQTFFKNSVKNLFSGFVKSPLGIKDDFFFLLQKSPIFYQNSGFEIDFKSGFLRAGDYIFIRAVLKNNYDDANLIAIHKQMQKLGILINSGAVFAAYSKQNGGKEGAIFGSVSIALSLAFLLLAFRNFKVLWLFWIAVFGFLCGLCVSLFWFENIHVLTIVIGTSLIGLMLDFAACWLGFNANKKLENSSIKLVLPSFVLALIISVCGYVLFLFSPMIFLHQIAIFSVFSLIGAFICSYFLLPNLLQGANLKSFEFFEVFLTKLEKIGINFGNFLNTKIAKFSFFTIFLFLVHIVSNGNFNDNIKNYSQFPKELLNEANLVLNITNNKGEFKFIKAKREVQEQLINELLRQNLIRDFTSLDKFFNTKQRQEQLKDDFKNFANNDKILNIYQKFGIDVKQKIDEILNLKTYDESELEPYFSDFNVFFKNPEFILIKDPVTNENFFNTLTKFNAKYSDIVKNLSHNFTQIKIGAIYIKIFGFIFAFLVLYFSLGIKNTVSLMAFSLFISFLILAIFMLFGDADIFVIFGLVLGLAVGLDYMIFSLKKAEARAKIFGILTACSTSIFSFLTLGLSQTKAIANFGISVSLSLILTFIFSLTLVKK